MSGSIALLFALSTPADAQCIPDGTIVQCLPNGNMRVEFDAGYIGADTHYYWFLDGPLEAFNAGQITSPADALELEGLSVTYLGAAGGFLSGDTALRIDAFDGVARAEIAHDIESAFGIRMSVNGGLAPHVAIELTGGTIDASIVGIWLENNTTSVADIVIGPAARIISPSALEVLTGASHVVLAGTIAEHPEVEGQASVLSDSNDILELHPGYHLDGTIDSRGGANELRLGGAGTDTFNLGQVNLIDDQGVGFLNFSSFTKTGSSTWTLQGTMAGAPGMDIQSGTVSLDDALLDGTVTIRDSARLGGIGTLGALEVLGGATLAPGHLSAGTLVAENVLFQSGSILEIGVGATTHGRLEADNITIEGGTLRVRPSSAAAGSYALVHGNITGAFNTVVSQSDRYVARLDSTNIDPTKLVIDLQRTGVTFASYAKTPEQAAVAALLDAMGEAAPYYAQLDGMDADAAADLMGQMAGSGFAATNSALLQQSGALTGASLGRIQQQAGTLGPTAGPLGYAAFSTGGWYDGLQPSAWGRLIAGTSTIGGSIAGSTALVGGFDVDLAEDWTLGLLASMGSSAITAGNASTDSFDLSAGLYGAREWGRLALRFGGSLTHHSVGSRRRVTGPGVDEMLVGSYGALTGQFFAELAQEFDFGPVGLEVFGDVAYARHMSPGFTETGGAGALTVAASSSDAIDTTLGARITQQVAMGTRLMTLGATIGWKHRWTAVPTTYNSFAGAAPFPVAGISTAGSALVAGANLRLDLDEQSGLDVAYAFEWGSTGAAHSFSAKYAHRF